MSALDRNRHPSVNVTVLHAPESHPGRRQGPHLDFEQELAAATTVTSAVGKSRRIVLENSPGDPRIATSMLPALASYPLGAGFRLHA